MNSIWINQLSHYGFLAFFGIIFPMASLMGFIIIIIDSYMLFYLLTYGAYRETIIEMKNTKIYNDLLQFLTYSSLIVNGALFAFKSKSYFGFLNLNNPYDELLFLLIFEHTLFGVNIILSLVLKDIPCWVQQTLHNRKIKSKLYNNSNTLNAFTINKSSNLRTKDLIFHSTTDEKLIISKGKTTSKYI